MGDERARLFRYHFCLEGPAGIHDDPAGTLLPDDGAADGYARRIIRELKEAGGYDEPYIRMIVKNSAGDVIHIIQF